MATEPRACRDCGEPITPKRGPGRPPTRCEACRTAPRTCEECGRRYTYRGAAVRRFCTASCASVHNHRLAGHQIHPKVAPKPQPEPEQATCFVCGTAFTPELKTTRFCSRDCRVEFDTEALGLLRERQEDRL